MINYFLGIKEQLFYETYAVGAILIVGVFISQFIRRPRSRSETVVVAGE